MSYTRGLLNPNSGDRNIQQQQLNNYKWHAGKAPIDLENQLQQFIPTDKEKKKSMVKFVDDKIQVYSKLFAELNNVEKRNVIEQFSQLFPEVAVDRDFGNVEEWYDKSRSKKLAAWAFFQSQMELQNLEGHVDEEFIVGFWKWLMGAGTKEEIALTPWGRTAPYWDDEVKAYISELFNTYYDHREKMYKLAIAGQMHTLKGIDQFALYYKFMVHGKFRGKPPDDFLDDFMDGCLEAKRIRSVAERIQPDPIQRTEELDKLPEDPDDDDLNVREAGIRYMAPIRAALLFDDPDVNVNRPDGLMKLGIRDDTWCVLWDFAGSRLSIRKKEDGFFETMTDVIEDADSDEEDELTVEYIDDDPRNDEQNAISNAPLLNMENVPVTQQATYVVHTVTGVMPSAPVLTNPIQAHSAVEPDAGSVVPDPNAPGTSENKINGVVPNDEDDAAALALYNPNPPPQQEASVPAEEQLAVIPKPAPDSRAIEIKKQREERLEPIRKDILKYDEMIKRYLSTADKDPAAALMVKRAEMGKKHAIIEANIVKDLARAESGKPQKYTWGPGANLGQSMRMIGYDLDDAGNIVYKPHPHSFYHESWTKLIEAQTKLRSDIEKLSYVMGSAMALDKELEDDLRNYQNNEGIYGDPEIGFRKYEVLQERFYEKNNSWKKLFEEELPNLSTDFVDHEIASAISTIDVQSLGKLAGFQMEHRRDMKDAMSNVRKTQEADLLLDAMIGEQNSLMASDKSVFNFNTLDDANTVLRVINQIQREEKMIKETTSNPNLTFALLKQFSKESFDVTLDGSAASLRQLKAAWGRAVNAWTSELKWNADLTPGKAIQFALEESIKAKANVLGARANLGIKGFGPYSTSVTAMANLLNVRATLDAADYLWKELFTIRNTEKRRLNKK
jgi:hypothetical protein